MVNIGSQQQIYNQNCKMKKQVSVLFMILNVVMISCKDYFVYLPLDNQGRTPTNAHFRCVKQSKDQIGLCVITDQNGIWNQFLQAFVNAKNAGLRLQIGTAPCRSLDPDTIVSQLLATFDKNSVERFWIFPYNLIQTCTWADKTPQSNCKYLVDVLNLLKKAGYKTGISGIRQFWQSTFGAETACPEVASELLAWWPQDQQQDSQPNFNGYKQFGGWKKPYIKLYDQADVCGIDYGKCYYE